ncbi:NAD-dependent epimerase/dehydratase family protein [Pseudooceanicola sp. MF1-13]|uniref:NAD-dependent epimerase/dehydratase family protein n=1 Tax=Pseudooceanicola sp. MF1-13 TaxID=3379095 RepID=UPI00389202CE
MKRVLVTGGTGFVGRQVIRALKNRAKVHATLRPGQQIEGVTTIETPDLFAESQAWWGDVLRDIDIVIHLAWIATPGEYLTSPVNHDCMCGTLTMARAAAGKVARFVGIGTCFEYEMTGKVLGFNAPLDPQTPYAGAKAGTHAALQGLFAQSDTQLAWARLFHLYGDGEDPRRLVPFLHQKLAAGEPVDMTSGKQVRDFIDVTKAGDMLADVALGDITGALNICTGTPITVRELAESIADGYGRRDLLRFGARPENLFDPPHVVGSPLQSKP